MVIKIKDSVFFELAEHYCSETTKSMNKNTIQTIKKLALSSGISKEEI